MKRSLFLSQMQKMLETDLRSNEHGCKIQDVNVRLGSGIRVDKFYEAELLFHNFTYIKRFAYLIARDIIASTESSESSSIFIKGDSKNIINNSYVVLLGYENYSAVLVYEIKKLLQEYLNEKDEDRILCLIDSNTNRKYPHVSFDSLKAKQKNEISEIFNSTDGDKDRKIYCYTIIPVGSTMSTIYKLHNSFVRGTERLLKCKYISDDTEKIKGNSVQKAGDEKITEDKIREKVDFVENYCIVAVGDVYKNFIDEKFALIEPYSHYIDQITPNQENHFFKIKLKKEEENQGATYVKFFLGVPAEWGVPNSGIQSENQPPLAQVDKTSTLIDISFQTKLPKKVLNFYQRNDKDDKIEELKSIVDEHPVRHGHIRKGDNHYEFYFDFKKIVACKKGKIEEWAKEERKKIESDAYNIVISPLQISNASFLKVILDKVFGSSLHLLHIDINFTGKENIRTKFSYICEELKRISTSYAKVNFYYVDDSICTGSTISRAYKFLQMLCDQAEIKMTDINDGNERFKYKKVFLLVNRSSYETAHTWVENPNEDWLGFINLCIPSYNTHANICPGCRTRDRFELLAKRSASSELAQYFYKNSHKHNCRTPEEFDIWQNDEMMTSPSYFQWFYWWFDSYQKKEEDEINQFLHEFEKLDKYPNDKINNCTIKDFIDFVLNKYDENKKEKAKNHICELAEKMIAEEHLRRLRTMNTAYRELIYDEKLQNLYDECANKKGSSNDAGNEANHEDEDENFFKNYVSELKSKIIKLLGDCFENEKSLYEQVMDYISYIKVISRTNLVKNYFIEEAIIEVMKKTLDILIEERSIIAEKVEEDDYKEYLNIYNHIRGIDGYLQYRIYKILSRRLSLRHSEYILRPEIVAKSFFARNKMKEKIAGGSIVGIPDENSLTIEYTASIKTATMAEKDEQMLYNISTFQDKLNEALFNNELKNYKSNTSEDKIKEHWETFKNNLTRKVNLENTAMLFDFVSDLSDRCSNLKDDVKVGWKYEGYDGKGGLAKRKEIINKIKDDARKWISSATIRSQDNVPEDETTYLYQNPLSSYLLFYKYYNKKQNEDQKIKIWDDKRTDGKIEIYSAFVSMINYFNILKYLTDSDFEEKRQSEEHHDSLPYIYEDLCFSVKDMTECSSCYILYREAGETAELVSRSGYRIGCEDSSKNDLLSSINIGVENLDSLVSVFEYKTKDKTEDKTNEYYKDMFEGKIEVKKEPHTGEIQIVKTTQKDNDELRHWFGIIKISYSHIGKSKTENSERAFYVILDFSKEINENYIMSKALKILFLRERLRDALRRDYAELIDFRFDCGYIKSIRKEFNIIDKNENLTSKDSYDYPNIMHISDLHIQNEIQNKDKLFESIEKIVETANVASKQYTAKYGEYSSEKKIDVKELLSKNSKNPEKTVDLLAVTGDLINAGANAKDSQDKYKNVRQLLLKIAECLWGVECENDDKCKNGDSAGKSDGTEGKKAVYLPHDWKRRILIVPGNHDYTSMNDVSIELDKNNESRKIKAGFPAMRSGGTMSKLTYYIEFLMDFLDAPTDELVQNDMNEVRTYKNLNIMVGMFNTVSKSNSLQTNKVSLNIEKIKELIKKSGWQSCAEQSNEDDNKNIKKIILTHHSPEYTIDYFDDKYEYWKYRNIIEDGVLCKIAKNDAEYSRLKKDAYDLYKIFEESYMYFKNILYYYIIKENEQLDKPSVDTVMFFSKNLFAKKFDYFKKKIECLSPTSFEKAMDTLVYSDMKLLYDVLRDESKIESDEFKQNLLYKSKQLYEIQKADNSKLESCFNEISNIDIALSGHEHDVFKYPVGQNHRYNFTTFIIDKLIKTKNVEKNNIITKICLATINCKDKKISLYDWYVDKGVFHIYGRTFRQKDIENILNSKNIIPW